MLDQLRGVVLGRADGAVIVDCGGLGLRLRVPSRTAESLREGAEARLFCYLTLREEQFHLYGFADVLERDLFLVVLGVSGVGPEKAIALLSALTPGEIASAVAAEDGKRFEAVRGIGQRLAARLALELKGKVDGFHGAGKPGAPPAGAAGDACLALEQLGYSRAAAEQAVRGVAAALGEVAGAPALIRAALAALQRGAGA